MTPKEAMELALELAKQEKNLLFAMNDAHMAYQVCGLTPAVEGLMQDIMQRAAVQADPFSLSSAALMYQKMLNAEYDIA